MEDKPNYLSKKERNLQLRNVGRSRSRDRFGDDHHEDETLGEITPKYSKKNRWRKRTKSKKKYFPDVEQQTSQFAEIPESEEVSVEMIAEEEIYCLSARTALIIPFLYKTENSFYCIEDLIQRTFPTPGGDVNIWQHMEVGLKEVYDLRPHFRQVLGLREKTITPEGTWTAHRLKLNEAVRRELFENMKLYLIQNGNESIFDAVFESVELHLSPRGATLLVIHINWNPPWKAEKNSLITLDDLRSLIYVSRYKKKIEGVCNGWGFSTPLEDYDDQLKERLRATLGDDLFQARVYGRTASLGHLANWLVSLPGENAEALLQRVNTPRHGIHHTTVVVSRELSEDSLNEYLFHLRRAFGQKNRPPPNSAGVLGRVLVWRRNKYIGISREGTVSISWPIKGNNETFAFEVHHWHQKFQGIYLILALHVHAEKLVFEELSDLSAIQAENLATDSTFEQMQRQRNRLRNLASVMTRYTVSMSSSDCGGTTEYSEFFIALREVYGVPELREELSGELKDVLAVVESNYLEEERRQRDAEEEQRRMKNDILARINKEKSSHRQRFEIILSIFGSITLPWVIAGGVWGMNLTTLPNVNFWILLLCCFLASALILIVLIALLMVRNFKFFKVRKGTTDENVAGDSIEAP